MDIEVAVTHCLKNYATFSGRAARSEYWYWVLFTFVGGIAIGFLDGAVFGGIGIGMLFSLALLLPGLAVSVRRLHDLNKSGWWLLISLIPLVGAILLIVWAASKGTEGDNQFGPDPLSGIPTSTGAGVTDAPPVAPSQSEQM